jgi:hypothetical protein
VEQIRVRIGAIVTFGGGQAGDQYFRPQPVVERQDRKRVPVWNASREILGSSLVQRSVAKMRNLGADPVRTVRETSSSSFLPSATSKAASFPVEWERAVDEAVKNGIEKLILLRVGIYTDLDFAEMLRFHDTTRAVLTQAYGPEGPLDAAVVNTSALQGTGLTYRRALSTLMSQQQCFRFDGYINRLSSVREFYQLAHDGLYGRCGLRPCGREISDGVWAEDGARIDSSVTLSGPAFVAAGAEIASFCTLTGGCSVERNCKIDYGTLIQESCVLESTYVGVALDVRRSIVAGQKIFRLNRNEEIHITDERLIAPHAKNTSFWGGFGSWAVRTAQQAD